MQYSLKQIIEALEGLYVIQGDKMPALDELKEAKELITDALKDLEFLQVCGRGALDTLLGCMMGLEAIAGDNNG